MRKWQKFGLVFLAFIFSVNVLGYSIGSLNSPRYGSEIESLQYVISNVEYKFSDDGLENLKLEAGPHEYTYSLDKDELSKRLRSTTDLVQLKSPRRNRIKEMYRMAEWIGITTAVPGGVIGAGAVLKAASKEPSILRAARSGNKFLSGRYIIALVVLGSASGYLGYSLGYEDLIDYENPTFVKTISDSAIYQRLVYDVQQCSRYENYLKNGFVQMLKDRTKIANILDVETYTTIDYSKVPPKSRKNVENVQINTNGSKMSSSNVIKNSGLMKIAFDPKTIATLKSLEKLRTVEAKNNEAFCTDLAMHLSETKGDSLFKFGFEVLNTGG